MKEIFEYFKLNCFENESVLRVEKQDLWFNFEGFQIVAQFHWINERVFEDDFISVSELDAYFLEAIEFNKIYLQVSINYLYEDENIDLRYFDSCKYQMYKVVNQIYEKYSNAVSSFLAKTFCDDDNGWEFGCPVVWNYGFHIEINKEYWGNKDFFSFIIEKVNYKQYKLVIPHFYNAQKNNDSFNLSILNSNTKIRRLGYLKILLKMIVDQPKISISKINFKFEKYCQDYNQYLQNHKNKKGNVVITKTGNSAKPYIELAISLGLIQKSTGVFEIGKNGKVYNILKEKIDEPETKTFLFQYDDFNTNPFVLSQYDIAFFLEILLKEDYWFLYSIMEQAVLDSSISYAKLRPDFKSILLKQIGRFIDVAQIYNSKNVLSLKIIERRINDWKKSEVYMEHVLMPRLNWLFDMGLIELRADLSFNLTAIGERLFYNLTVWDDIALHPIISPNVYIDNYFMKVINNIFNLQKKDYTGEVSAEFIKCLEESFMLFRTMAPNRITFSLFARYTKHSLFWRYSQLIDTENIKSIFERKQFPDYIYKYQEHYKDGYIQKK